MLRLLDKSRPEKKSEVWLQNYELYRNTLREHTLTPSPSPSPHQYDIKPDISQLHAGYSLPATPLPSPSSSCDSSSTIVDSPRSHRNSSKISAGSSQNYRNHGQNYPNHGQNYSNHGQNYGNVVQNYSNVFHNYATTVYNYKTPVEYENFVRNYENNQARYVNSTRKYGNNAGAYENIEEPYDLSVKPPNFYVENEQSSANKQIEEEEPPYHQFNIDKRSSKYFNEEFQQQSRISRDIGKNFHDYASAAPVQDYHQYNKINLTRYIEEDQYAKESVAEKTTARTPKLVLGTVEQEPKPVPQIGITRTPIFPLRPAKGKSKIKPKPVASKQIVEVPKTVSKGKKIQETGTKQRSSTPKSPKTRYLDAIDLELSSVSICDQPGTSETSVHHYSSSTTFVDSKLDSLSINDQPGTSGTSIHQSIHHSNSKTTLEYPEISPLNINDQPATSGVIKRRSSNPKAAAKGRKPAAKDDDFENYGNRRRTISGLEELYAKLNINVDLDLENFKKKKSKTSGQNKVMHVPTEAEVEFEMIEDSCEMKRKNSVKQKCAENPIQFIYNPNKSRNAKDYASKAKADQRAKNNFASRRSRYKKKLIMQYRRVSLEYFNAERYILQNESDLLTRMIRHLEHICRLMGDSEDTIIELRRQNGL